MEKNELDESFDEIEESDDTDWKSETIKLREKAIRQREKTKELRESLKEREAKLAEFEKSSEKKEIKSDETLLKRLDTLALKVSGIQAEDEVELFNKWKTDTGRDAEAVIGSPIFQKELADLRTAKANAAATDVKGGGSSSAAKGTLEEQADYWISKTTKDSRGDPLFSDEMPNDYKLHAAIVRKLNESSKDKKKFYNS